MTLSLIDEHMDLLAQLKSAAANGVRLTSLYSTNHVLVVNKVFSMICCTKKGSVSNRFIVIHDLPPCPESLRDKFQMAVDSDIIAERFLQTNGYFICKKILMLANFLDPHQAKRFMLVRKSPNKCRNAGFFVEACNHSEVLELYRTQLRGRHEYCILEGQSQEPQLG